MKMIQQSIYLSHSWCFIRTSKEVRKEMMSTIICLGGCYQKSASLNKLVN